ncbi:MAG: endonuclease [Actinobacteria bacterium]|nr:endonuclease [Actinomycetota bacterium]
MTWNLWWRFGPWERRQAAIAEVLRAEGADVIGLQEVFVERDGVDQAAVLAGALGFHVATAPVRFHDTAEGAGLAFTNAVLSRWPIAAATSLPLPRADGTTSHRNALAVRIDSPFGALCVVSTHLDWQFDRTADRVAQVRAVAGLVAAERPDPASGFPAVLLGDLNAVPHSDEVRLLTGATGPAHPGLVFTDVWDAVGSGRGDTWDGANPYLAEATWPNRRIDYVLVSWPRPKPVGSPVAARLAGVEAVDGVVASDHWAVVADLRTG